MDDRVFLPLFVLGCLVAYNAVVWLGRFLYFRHHKSAQHKRRANNWTAIFVGTSMFLFVTLTMNLSLGFISLIPLTLITYLSIRWTIVCDTCRRTIHTQSSFSVCRHHSKCAERDPEKFH
jgi:uncharacterized membrane protein